MSKEEKNDKSQNDDLSKKIKIDIEKAEKGKLNVPNLKESADWSKKYRPESHGYKPNDKEPNTPPPQDSGTGATTDDSK